jgi:hypothetical protein
MNMGFQRFIFFTFVGRRDLHYGLSLRNKKMILQFFIRTEEQRSRAISV